MVVCRCAVFSQKIPETGWEGLCRVRSLLDPQVHRQLELRDINIYWYLYISLSISYCMWLWPQDRPILHRSLVLSEVWWHCMNLVDVISISMLLYKSKSKRVSKLNKRLGMFEWEALKILSLCARSDRKKYARQVSHPLMALDLSSLSHSVWFASSRSSEEKRKGGEKEKTSCRESCSVRGGEKSGRGRRRKREKERERVLDSSWRLLNTGV